MVGAATFYPFYAADYNIDNIPSNPFIFKNGMVLFGDYQFGAHRYFSNEHPNLGQLLFSPEDCSTAIGKATDLKEYQIVGINTSEIRKAYSGHNEYGYKAITSSFSGEQLSLGTISPGDIYVRGGHTAIVSGNDNRGNIQTLDFTRDIDIEVNKRLGGGTYQYDLVELSKGEIPIYILRSDLAPLKESISSSELISRIDSNYTEKFGDEPQDIVGDYSIFICDDFFA